VDGVRNLFFRIFRPQTINRLNLYSNDQIRIQTIKFEFKRTHQQATPHYHPPAQRWVVSSASGNARASSNTDDIAHSG
jgi:hypothetical protein